MAMKEARKHPDAGPEMLSQQETARGMTDDLQRLIAHVQENPLLYLAGLVFVAVCVAAGVIYGLRQQAQQRQFNTAYAEALAEEDPALQAAALANLSPPDNDRAAEVLYMQAEAAVQAGELATAMNRIEQILADHYETPYASRAHLILGHLAGKDGNWEDAIEAYQDLIEGWPDSFWARQAHFKIGQAYEQLEQWEPAKAAYEEQINVFPESSVAQRAQNALQELAQDYPELFPAQEDATVEAAEPAEAPAETTEGAMELIEDPGRPLPTVDPEMGPTDQDTPVVVTPDTNEGTITVPQQVPELGDLAEPQELQAPVMDDADVLNIPVEVEAPAEGDDAASDAAEAETETVEEADAPGAAEESAEAPAPAEAEEAPAP